MRCAVTDDQFEQEIFSAKRSAWRWEQQRIYDIGSEQDDFQAFLAGQPRPPSPDLAGYYRQVRSMTRAGIAIGRVRIVDTPLTDYQRWRNWMDHWNREAGEDIHYLSRPLLRQMGRPPFQPDADWWLVDGERLLIMEYAVDLSGRAIKTTLLVGEPEVRLARLWRLAVVSWAVEEELAPLPAAA